MRKTIEGEREEEGKGAESRDMEGTGHPRPRAFDATHSGA